MNPTQIPFQYDKPVFVKISFQGSGKVYNVGDEFKWKELAIDPSRVQTLYTQDYLYHNTELELAANRVVGDGLEQASLPELQAIARKEDAKISNILMKQVGLIRSNRLHPRTIRK